MDKPDLSPREKRIANLRYDPEIQRERGRKNTGFRLRKSRNCSKRCPLYGRCMFAPLSKNFGGKCALANMSELTDKSKRQYLKILTGDRQQFQEILQELTAEVLFDVKKEGNFKDKLKFIESVMKFYTTLFGTKAEVQVKGYNVALTWEDLKRMYQKEKGDKVENN